MASEIDQDEDQMAPQQAPAPSAPAAAAPVTSTPAAPAANTSGRFVGFDQMLQMNRPYAEQAASGLTQQANNLYDAAQNSAQTAFQDVSGQAQRGVNADGYTGPKDSSPAFEDAKSKAREGQQFVGALGSGVEGIQALLQQNGQGTDAARYNALFANSVGQPQFQETQKRFAGFDELLGQKQKDADSFIDFGKKQSGNLKDTYNRLDSQQQQAAAQAFAPLEKSAQDWAWRMAKDSSRDPFGTKTSKEGFLAALDKGEPGAVEMYNNYFKTRDGNAYAEYVKMRDAARGKP